MKFQLVSDFKPMGDQPAAIASLVNGINDQEKYQTLLGVTGSGKTFTIANVVEQVQVPTLVLAHNKTLAAQLYNEFKAFFPNNAVEYFVSYYDYYQPEAYIPVTGVYIEKDLSINEDIERMRLSTTSALLSGRRDVLVVASVSCLYGIGNPLEFQKNVISIEEGQNARPVPSLCTNWYKASMRVLRPDFLHGNFRVKGDVIDIFPGYSETPIRVHFFGNEIELIESFDRETNKTIERLDKLNIYPANMFVTSPDVLQAAIRDIQDDLVKQIEFFQSEGKP